MRIAASTSYRVQVLHLLLGDLADLRLVTWPATSRPGALEPLSSFAAFLRKCDTGGVLHLEGKGPVLVDR